MNKDYWDQHYRMTTINGADHLSVFKSSGSDWVHIQMVINERYPATEITLRSKHHAEQLYFMLGQMLGR